jgi:hypothetical protein
MRAVLKVLHSVVLLVHWIEAWRTAVHSVAHSAVYLELKWVVLKVVHLVAM